MLQQKNTDERDISYKNLKTLDYEFIILTGILICMNSTLMAFVWQFWLNPSFHTYITGRPL